MSKKKAGKEKEREKGKKKREEKEEMKEKEKKRKKSRRRKSRRRKNEASFVPHSASMNEESSSHFSMMSIRRRRPDEIYGKLG